jgi:hypothetical protein
MQDLCWGCIILRLREIGLYYSIPQENLEKWFNGNNVKVGLSGNNIVNIFWL